jgi:hypothetical protein
MVAAGRYEAHGVLLLSSPFESGLVGPATYTTPVSMPGVTLSSTSPALDRGLVLANVNDGFTGSGPDLGALERGCALPIYGIRPEGTDESNEPTGCVGECNRDGWHRRRGRGFIRWDGRRGRQYGRCWRGGG